MKFINPNIYTLSAKNCIFVVFLNRVNLIFMVVSVHPHNSLPILRCQRFFDQITDLNSLSNVGMNVDKVVEQTVAKEKTEKKTVGI